jgi:hypothetical protein
VSLHRLTYIKTLFEAILFVILVPLILLEVWHRRGKGIGRKVLEQGSVIP